MGTDRTQREDGPSAERDGGHPTTASVPEYRKPSLRRLGVWNVFTRQGPSVSESPKEVGFYHFGF